MMILAKECWNKPQDRRVVMIYCCQIVGYPPPASSSTTLAKYKRQCTSVASPWFPRPWLCALLMIAVHQQEELVTTRPRTLHSCHASHSTQTMTRTQKQMPIPPWSWHDVRHYFAIISLFLLFLIQFKQQQTSRLGVSGTQITMSFSGVQNFPVAWLWKETWTSPDFGSCWLPPWPLEVAVIGASGSTTTRSTSTISTSSTASKSTNFVILVSGSTTNVSTHSATDWLGLESVHF